MSRAIGEKRVFEIAMARLRFWRTEAPAPQDDPPAERTLSRLRSGSVAPTAPLTAIAKEEAAELIGAYETSGQGWFWSTDAYGRLAYLSPTAAAQLHLDDSEPAPAFADLFARAEDDGGTTRTLPFLFAKKARFEKLVVRAARSAANEEDRWWSLSGTPHHDAAGNFTGFKGSGVDITEERIASESAAQLALCDSLTGLPNRLRVNQVLEANLVAIDHHKRPCAVMMMDLDRFKHVNDTLGHPAGDILLQQVADRLLRIVGDDERVFRLGGDEFKIVLRDIADRDELTRIATDIISIVSQPYSVEGSRCIIGASVGIAIAPDHGRTAEDLTRNADLALYAAKGSGRGRHRFFESDLLKAAEDKRQIESDLRDALVKGELRLVYQPIVDTSTNRPTGVEALVRWDHPDRGPVSPGIFIPIAEESNVIESLGEWILRRACEEAATWPGKLRVAVNVSPIQFTKEAFPGIVMSALASSGLAPERLELEITEGVFLGASDETDRIFRALKDLGVRLALDDFGTGYSSLSYLRTAPFDKIKIDQSFMRRATVASSRSGAIIAAIVTLAEAIGMETTAEGIESLDQLELCRTLRVSHIQGFIYSPGVDSETLTANLASGDWIIEPSGPARQRGVRKSQYRRIGAVFGKSYKSVLVRNISESGALIEGLGELPVGAPLLLDFGDGEVVLAQMRRADRRQQGVEFEELLDVDDNNDFTFAHRVSPYLISSVGLPTAGNYPERALALDPARGGNVEEIATKLGLIGRAEQAREHLLATTNVSVLNSKGGSQAGLTDGEVRRLIDAARASANPLLKYVVELLLLTGVRQRELLESRWENFDLEKGLWYIPDAATRKLRTVKLPPEALEIIAKLPRIEGCDNLIVNPKTRQPYRSFSSSWETVRTKAKLPHVEIDELRHCGAEMLKKTGR